MISRLMEAGKHVGVECWEACLCWWDTVWALDKESLFASGTEARMCICKDRQLWFTSLLGLLLFVLIWGHTL